MKKLTDKEKRFCQEYIIDFNGTQAAIRAGYSSKTAYAIACEMLQKPKIRTVIDKRLVELSLSAEESQKLVSDIARGSLNDYFVIRKVERIPRIQVALRVVIDNLKEQIAFEKEYLETAEKEIVVLSKEEIGMHEAVIQRMEKELIRYQVELRRNPTATRIIDGPVEWVDVAELDMPKLVADKEKGKIKSIAPGQFGMKVEMYPADAALTNLLRIHGKFAKDNEQSKPVILPPMSDDQVEKVIKALREVKTA